MEFLDKKEHINENIDMPRVSIITLNWNGWEDTLECLESLYRITYPNYDVIVVDNNSKDESIEKIKEYAEGKIEVVSKYIKYNLDNKPIEIVEYTREETEVVGDKEKKIVDLASKNKIILIKNEMNYGFAEGNNIGMEYALKILDPDYVLLLNNDTIVDSEFLEKLVMVAESNNKIGIVGGKIHIYGTNIFDSAGSLYTNIGYGKSRGHLEEDKGQYNKQEEIAMVTACCSLIRKEILEQTFLFDPLFFLYYEEVDFNIRARGLGYLIIYTPYSLIWHKFSRSITKFTLQPILFKQFYTEIYRSRILIKYYPLRILLLNAHLILLSYLYSNYLLLRYGGFFWFLRLNYNLLKSLVPSLKERLTYKHEMDSNWVDHITYYNLKDYIHFKHQMKQRYF